MLRCDPELWVKTTTDMLGRTVKVERPTTEGGTLTTQYIYNDDDDDGRLWKTETLLGSALVSREITTYNTLGEPETTGSDMDDDEELTQASMDRIMEYNRVFESINGDWFLHESETTYPDDNASTHPIINHRYSRLSGYSDETPPAGVGVNAVLVAETTDEDAYGNKVTSKSWVDRTSKTTTTILDSTLTQIDNERIYVNGLLMSATATAEGAVVQYRYDGLGRQTQTIDPRLGSSYTRYYTNSDGDNLLGQIAEIENAAENVTEYGYDNDGRVKWVEDPLDQKVYFTYNSRGEKTGEYGATYPVKYGYDNYGQQTDMYTYRGTNSLNLIDTDTEFNNLALSAFDHTHWAYQPSTGLLLTKTDPDSKSITYTYWPQDHQLKRRTWARNNGAVYTDYTYENYTRLLEEVDYSDSTPDITYSYTRLGQLDTVLDGQGYRKFVYTDEGALDTETVKVSETGDTLHVIDHAQDAYGRSEGYDLFVDGSSTASLTMDYGYNTQNGRLETIEGTFGTQTFYSKYYYVDNSDLIDGHSIRMSSSPSSFFYDRTVYEPNRNLIDRVESGFNSSADYRSSTLTTRKSYYDYTNDDAGRRTARTDWYKPSSTPSTINNSFGYNVHNELETADFGSDVYDYAYDNIGNRRSSTLNSSTTAYAPDKLNQYDTVGGKTYRYDDDGNLETDGEKWVCTWDAENRLTSIRTWHSGEGVVTGDKKYVFEYDYDGRRYKKTTYTYSSNQWGAGTSYSFVWNGDHIIREKWSTGGEKFYTWGLEGKLLSMSAGVYNIYYGYDGNKNVTDLIRNGEYAHRYKYDAFGNVTSASSFIGVTINPFRFSSEYVDNESGWSAYKYRYYSPQTGRFLNRDPIEEQGGLNLYGFVGNSPVNRTDQLGLDFGDVINWIGKNAAYPEPDVWVTVGMEMQHTSWGGAFEDLGSWLAGHKPTVTYYNEDDNETLNVKKSSIVKKLRNGFVDKNKNRGCGKWMSYTNVALKYEPREFFSDLPNGTAHFVGSGDGDVLINVDESNDCKTVAIFMVTNVTSLKSFLYHMIPDSWNNNHAGTPAANWVQVYTWMEEFDCK